jgi:hypothetical protein
MIRALTILAAVAALAVSAPASARAVTGGVDAVDCLMTSLGVNAPPKPTGTATKHDAAKNALNN